jgi:hypothetical protein
MENIQQIPGLKKESLKQIHDLIDIRNQVMPRIAVGNDLNEVSSLLENFSIFLYFHDKEIEQQNELYKDSMNLLQKLKPFEQPKDIDFKYIKENFFLSKNPLIRASSFSITLFVLGNVVIVGFIKTINYSETVIIGLLTFAAITGIGLATLTKR